MDRRAWWATVHGLANSWTRLSDFHFSYRCVLAAPWGMWSLSFMTRDQIYAPCSGSIVLTTGPPGKSLSFILNCKSTLLHVYLLHHVVDFCFLSQDCFLWCSRVKTFSIYYRNENVWLYVSYLALSWLLLYHSFFFILLCILWVFFFIIPVNTSNYFSNIYLNV